MRSFRFPTRHLARRRLWTAYLIFGLLLGACVVPVLRAQATASQPPSSRTTAASSASPQIVPQAVLDKYCITCHNQKLRTAGVVLESLDPVKPGAGTELGERVIAKLHAGSMPPPGMPRPDAATYQAVATSLENEIDRAWAANPNPGRMGAVHRLNREEYNHAIRDLFALDLDVKPLLPGDETADGSFDNFADVLTISTAHLERYMSVARQVTRLATGLPPTRPKLERFEVPLHVLQNDQQSEDLPFGSRGGIAVHYDFPGHRRVPHQSSSAKAVSGLHQGHGVAAANGRAPGWQAAETLHGRWRGQRQTRRG